MNVYENTCHFSFNYTLVKCLASQEEIITYNCNVNMQKINHYYTLQSEDSKYFQMFIHCIFDYRF